MCSTLKKVLNQLGDSHQICVNMYKTHMMTTCHGGTGQPSETDPNPQAQDIDIAHDLSGGYR